MQRRDQVACNFLKMSKAFPMASRPRWEKKALILVEAKDSAYRLPEHFYVSLKLSYLMKPHQLWTQIVKEWFKLLLKVWLMRTNKISLQLS